MGDGVISEGWGRLLWPRWPDVTSGAQAPKAQGCRAGGLQRHAEFPLRRCPVLLCCLWCLRRNTYGGAVGIGSRWGLMRPMRHTWLWLESWLRSAFPVRQPPEALGLLGAAGLGVGALASVCRQVCCNPGGRVWAGIDVRLHQRPCPSATSDFSPARHRHESARFPSRPRKGPKRSK